MVSGVIVKGHRPGFEGTLRMIGSGKKCTNLDGSRASINHFIVK
jgi:hypothetical protein